MYLLVVYDIDTTTDKGSYRLKKVFDLCVSYGHRVQYSVFEMEVDARQKRTFEKEIERLIDKSCDSVRIYSLGKHYREKISVIGVSDGFDVNDSLIF